MEQGGGRGGRGGGRRNGGRGEDPPSLFGVQVDGDDEPVEPEHLGEDEDEDHPDEEPGLLRRPPHSRVSHDADGVAGRQAAQAHRKAGPHVHEAPEKREENSLISRMLYLR